MFRTGGSRHAGTAAPPHRNIQDIKDKQNVDKEDFAFKVLEEINGTKYMYLSLLYGAIEYVSHKYQIFCAEDLEVFLEYLIPVVREGSQMTTFRFNTDISLY